MNAQDLKKAILQYAMQGKLVPQDPNDEPAYELLKRIKAEKEQLVKEGKIKKEKSLPPITEEEVPYELPHGWGWCRLQTILDKISAGGDKPKNFTKNQTETNIYPVIANGEKNDGILGYSNTPIIKEKSISVSGRGTMGFVCIREPNYIPIVRLLVLIPNHNINILYLKYLLICLSENGIGTAVKQLTIPMLSIKLIPIPPLDEQIRIVEKIEELMPLIDEYERNEQKLKTLNSKLPEQLRKSILQYAVEGKLVPQNPNDEPASELLKRIKAEKELLIKEGKVKKAKPIPTLTAEEIPSKIPLGWEYTKLGELIEIARGGSPRPIQDYITNREDGINWIKIGDSDKGGKYINSTTEKIIKEGMTKSRYVKQGDFLLSNSMSFGRPYILNINGCIHDGWLVLSNIDKCFCKDFLYYLLSSPYIFKQFCGKVSGAVVKNLNSEKVANAIVPIPPIAEQKQIVEKVNELMKRCDELEDTINKTGKVSEKLLESIIKNNDNTQISGLDKTNVIDIPKEINRRAIFNAYKIKKFKNDKHFCAIKDEKLNYVCETHLKLSLGGQYDQFVAGPADMKSRNEVKKIFKYLNWFNIIEGSANSKEQFIPDKNIADVEPLFDKCFSDKKEEINNLLNLFKNKTTRECEAVATLYAVWNDLIVENNDTSESIIIEEFYKWSDRKKEFKKSDLFDILAWMKLHQIIPDGTAPKTIKHSKQISLLK